MSPDATPPDICLAVYDGEELVMVYRDGPGSVRAAVRGQPALRPNACVRGRVVLVDAQSRLLDAIDRSRNAEGLEQELVRAGFTVLRTPAATLSWAL